MLDESPVLLPENKAVARLWQEAQRSGVQVYGEDKTFVYCRPESILALMRLYNIPKDQWERMVSQLSFLDDTANNLRPQRKKAK